MKINPRVFFDIDIDGTRSKYKIQNVYKYINNSTL